MKILSRALPSLTLLEWGAILSYFYFSGRLASFLHPMFRPLVLVTGILLVITAVCVGVFPEETCDHDHEEEGHTHGGLTPGSVLAFFLLIVPVALAAKVSPDSYGAGLIERRGLVEDIRSLPGVGSRFAHAGPPPASAPSLSLPGKAAVMQQSIARAGAALKQDSQQSIDKQLEEAAQETMPEPGLPTQTGGNENAPPGPSPGTYENPALQPNKSGNIPVQVTDLLYAAQEPFTRKDFEGKRIEIIGQYLISKNGVAKQELKGNSFMLVRLVMVCCAADMIPAALKIQATKKPAHLRPTSWLKVVGKVHYRPRPKGPSPDGIDYGGTPEPVIEAVSVSRIAAPAEKYVY
ncbi:MAG: TIGR03943 family putative permease subunit [Chthoniobacterales bacterium]